MPRIKHVFDDDDEIRALWIAGELDWARQRNGTSSFNGPRFWRKLGGSAVRFPGPDGATYCICSTGYRLPPDWHHVPLPLSRNLGDAGEKLNAGRHVGALETIRHAIDREIERLRGETRTGQRFSGAQAGRLSSIANLHSIRTRLSKVYAMKWKPLLDQAAAGALADFIARGSNHIAQARYQRETAVYNQFRERSDSERSNPVDDATSIAQWVANQRLYLNAGPRSGRQTHLRVNGSRVENSHGPVWKMVEFNRLARYLIRALREDRFFNGRYLDGVPRIHHINCDGVTLSLYDNTHTHNPLTVDEIGAILRQTAPRLAAGLTLAKLDHDARVADERAQVLDMAREHRP